MIKKFILLFLLTFKSQADPRLQALLTRVFTSDFINYNQKYEALETLEKVLNPDQFQLVKNSAEQDLLNQSANEEGENRIGNAFAPMIGFYSEGYPRNTLFLNIEIPVSLFLAVAPETLRQSILQQLQLQNIDQLKEQIKNGSITILPSIGIFNRETWIPDRQNIVFHELAMHHWNQPNNSSVNYLMGVFGAKNAMPAGDGGAIPFDSFQPIGVSPHDSENGVLAYSPNNAHLQINGDSSFWTVIFSQNKKEIIATYNILIEFHEGEPTRGHLQRAFANRKISLNDVINILQNPIQNSANLYWPFLQENLAPFFTSFLQR